MNTFEKMCEDIGATPLDIKNAEALAEFDAGGTAFFPDKLYKPTVRSYVATADDLDWIDAPAAQIAAAVEIEAPTVPTTQSDWTFENASQVWLHRLATRKRSPIAPSTLVTFTSYIRRISPIIGCTRLADINSATLKKFVQDIAPRKLSAKTIQESLAVIKKVVAAPVDPKTGNSIFHVQWNADFIDAPSVKSQKTPCFSSIEVQALIEAAASTDEAMLYCLLAGAGLRVSEALAIHINGREDQTSWNPGAATIQIRSAMFNGQETGRTKTVAGRRTVHLCEPLNQLLLNVDRTSGYLFQDKSGESLSMSTVRTRLAKRLDQTGVLIRVGGSKNKSASCMHAFRRFRVTHLRASRVLEEIIKSELGHSNRQDTTSIYSQQDLSVRKTAIESAGLGFFFETPLHATQKKRVRAANTGGRGENHEEIVVARVIL